MVYVEVTYPDGTVKRWAIPSRLNDYVIDAIEDLLGTPSSVRGRKL